MATTIVNESLIKWIAENNLTVTFPHGKLAEIPGVGKFVVVDPKDIQTTNEAGQNILLKGVILDTDFQIILNDSENALVDNAADYLLFQFGDRWYCSDTLTPEEIKEWKYLGPPALAFDSAPYLGIHGAYELTNGSREYKDWIKKAKFLGISSIGICEENTLAGTLPFQDACLKANMKPIIGETIIILTNSGAKMPIKLYVRDQDGWRNLLRINKVVNVDNEGQFIKESEFFAPDAETEGLICVLTPDCDLTKYLKKFQQVFSEVYFQIDFVEWGSDQKDEQWLLSIKNYFDNYLFEDGNTLNPILILDTYYLDKGDYEIKKYLNNIGKVGFKSSSKDQYFKSMDDVYLQAAALFNDQDDRWDIIIEMAVESLNSVCNSIDFQIKVGDFRLPEYEMSAEETMYFHTNEELFHDIIKTGYNKKIVGRVSDESVYLNRINEEVEVIKRGGFVSYFLILIDIINWCKSQGIWVGMGRGSAAGSLVSYCMGIVQIDPIKYGLLFSRFINAGRLGKSLPDIDTDFMGTRRDEVKRYMESKYGADFVTAIGTYGTFKIKSAIKDLCRERGADYTKTNFVVSMVDDAKTSFTELFKIAAQKPELKDFIQRNYIAFEKIPLLLNQVKNSSIHASGVVIVPKSTNENIYAQMPVKKIDGNLVSEWEGEWIDKAGFLKFDILGVKQLDKFAAITKLIKENTGETITYDSMDLYDVDVFELFKEGLTEDVFQFGTQGLKAYCKELRPDNVNDLIAAVALYRPGPMETGMHKRYIKIKNGSETAVYDPGTEDITKDTYAQIIYQEQIMQICSHMAGFNLVEADDIRKVLGKKLVEEVKLYKEKFVEGCVKNGYDKNNVSELWDKMEAFAKYSFNKSHAAAYAIMGYFSQWLKHKYPIEFWTVSLQFADDKEVIGRISELNKISNIEIASVDINKSTTEFFADRQTFTVYWALNSVKWVGDKGVEEVLEERALNGDFFSIEEFCDRVKGRSGINKRTIINLILAGAFDKIENVTPEHRSFVIKKYHQFTNQKLSDELVGSENWKPYQWVLKQKELTGFGFIDYSKIIKGSSMFATKQKLFKENADVSFANTDDEPEVVVSGILQGIIERKSKKGVFAQLEIIDNTDKLYITVWNDSYMPYRAELAEAKQKIIIVSGKITFDTYKNSNVVHSKSNTKIEIV